ncbi:metal ABC transporter permease [Thermogladius sp. 4427co]|uniref:metal ABC transporter permease n=1 Tax=Thermogladius sp. 4427co TaxID=3450718 RepID=UPI003F7AFC21
MVSATLSFSILSIIVAYRRLFYLAAEMPHVSFLAVTIGILVSYYIARGMEIPISIAIGLALVYVVGYMIHKRIEPSIATSIFVGSATSLSVIAAYFVLTRIPVAYSITSLIIGDPLLVGFSDILACIIILIITLTAFVLTYHEQASIGLDEVAVRIAGVDTRIYNFIAYTLLGLNTVGMLKIAGYIMEHVFILMPPAIAFALSKSYKGAVYSAVLSGIFSSLLGLHLSIVFNLAPSGTAGLIMLLLYVGILVVRKV